MVRIRKERSTLNALVATYMHVRRPGGNGMYETVLASLTLGKSRLRSPTHLQLVSSCTCHVVQSQLLIATSLRVTSVKRVVVWNLKPGSHVARGLSRGAITWS
jgi:hypothetical protein